MAEISDSAPIGVAVNTEMHLAWSWCSVYHMASEGCIDLFVVA